MALPEGVPDRIRRLVLENSVAHGGEARVGPILSRLLAGDASLRSSTAALSASIEEAIRAVTAVPLEAQRAELDRLGGPEATVGRTTRAASDGGFPDLPGAVDGDVVLRMAPFPSGALHIGNARMLYVNDHYRRQYHGKLLLVFDDTVGSEEKRIYPEIFDVILHDLEVAGVPVDAVYYKSDRLPIAYEWAGRVIDREAAYVCNCPSELLRENRARGLSCPERSQPREETRELWAGMLAGKFAQGEAVLRLRTDLNDPDPAFRDRVLFRISDLDHPRVGRKWKVWPLLEFSWAVDDIELGITHVLRGKDLVMEDRMQEFIWRLLGVKGPPFVHWGLLRVAEAKISKSKGYAQVKSGEYDSWADPRTWSIDALERRGISREALRRFTMAFGMSLADIEVPAETLYSENRQILDPTTPRRAFVGTPVRVEVEGYPAGLAEVELANHPERPELGTRRVRAGPSFWLAGQDVAAHLGEEVRLKDLVNIRLPVEGPGGDRIWAQFTSRENRRLPRLQWVGTPEGVAVDILDTDGSHRPGIGEGALRSARPRDIYQFERVGFVRVEADWTPTTEPVRVCFGHP